MREVTHRFYTPGDHHVRMKVLDLNGNSDTTRLDIHVRQGYSSPKPILNIYPAFGHNHTKFLLDASQTRDDEDSIWTLKFRWDFDGDGIFDTSYQDSSRITRTYPTPGEYNPRVEVKDPSGRVQSAGKLISVGIIDHLIKPDFTWYPDSILNDTLIQFDAGRTYHQQDPFRSLQFLWDWENDGKWDTPWLSSPITFTTFQWEVIQFVHLRVRDSLGLINDTIKGIRIYHRNREPGAHFSVSSLGGNANTRFFFNMMSCRDPESSPSDLLCRWDWNGDGLWDTDPLQDRFYTHVFGEPGVYPVKMEVEDPGGLKDIFEQDVFVGDGNNPTELYQDQRGNNWETYGTVRIGNLWWMARNLSVEDSLMYGDIKYDRFWWNYHVYGNLYSHEFALRDCPPGWRLPSRSDWESLLDLYSDEAVYEELKPGGSAGFSSILGGKGTHITFLLPTSWSGLGNYGYYWSSTKVSDASSNSVWCVTFDGVNGRVLTGFRPDTDLYSIRCVKNAN